MTISPRFRGKMRRRKAALAILLFLVGTTWAEEMPVPPELQAEVFKRIFSFDKALKNDILIFILYPEGKSESADEIARAFRRAGTVPKIVGLNEIDNQAHPPAVVYLTPGIQPGIVKQFCLENSVLSISGVPSYVEEGGVAISLGEENRRPRIIVNLKRLKAEAHELSSQVLKLARIVE